MGLARGGRLAAHKVGTRYVQSRTAAGGWSQQRYARRRANQADELVEATAGHLARLLAGAGGIPGLGGQPGLVVGGDRALVEAVLQEAPLRGLDALPARTLYDLPDPRLDVLQTAVERGSAVRVTISE